MRVLFVSTPGVGHIFPMVPLAWALRAAGHDVLFATTGEGLIVERAGLPVVDVKPGFDRRKQLEKMRREQPELVRERLHRRIDDLHTVAARFARVSEMLVDGVVAAAKSFEPDLVVQSQVQGSGYVVAGLLGVPLVNHGFGFARTDAMPEQFREHMAETFDRFGITDLPQRYTAIDVAPPSMLDRPVHGWSVRYVPYNGGGILPSWMSAPIAWPRVAVTLGTLAPETLGIDPIRRIIHIAEGHDAEFVLALGDTDLAELGPLPSNVRSAGWVPLNALLRSCAAVVHHGGAGSTLTSLVAGVPQLVLPTGADRHINAAAVTRRNAGLEAEPDDLSAELLTTLLRDSSLAAAAREVSAEIAALPSPAALVETLVDYVRTASGNEGGPSGTPAELAGGDRGGSGGTG